MPRRQVCQRDWNETGSGGRNERWHMNTKMKIQSTAISLEERRLIQVMPPKLHDWYGQTDEAQTNDESVYIRRSGIMKTLLALARQITTLGLLLMIGVAMTAGAGSFGLSRTSWKEEVLLHAGSKIIVSRTVERGGRHEIGQQPPIKEQSLSFTLPDTNESVTWEDKFTDDVGGANFLPMQLEIRKDRAYLVVHPMGSASYNKWGSPNPPYVVFKFQNKQWNQIPLQELPTEFTTPNLIFSSPDEEARKAGQRIVSAEAIKSIYARYKQSEYKTILRTPLDHWKPRPPGSNSGRMVRTGDGGWLGMDWFENQPSLEACLKKCAREKVSSQDCPCNTLFKGK